MRCSHRRRGWATSCRRCRSRLRCANVATTSCATGDEALPQLEVENFPSIAAGRPVAERQAEYRSRWPESAALVGKALPDHMFPRLFGAVSAPSMLDDLTPVLDYWQPDVVVHDAADFAAPILAAMAGVPNVTHGFGSVTPIQRVTADAAENEPLASARARTAPVRRPMRGQVAVSPGAVAHYFRQSVLIDVRELLPVIRARPWCCSELTINRTD